MRTASRLATALALSLAVVVNAQSPAPGDISRLKLRPSAVVEGPPVLANVLNFDEADPALLAAIGTQPVFAEKRLPAKTPKARGSRTEQVDASATDETAADPPCGPVTHDRIARRLAELGVNMSRVLICGAAECEIARSPKPAAAQAHPLATERAPSASSHDLRQSAKSADEPDAVAPLLRQMPDDSGSAPLTLADALRERVQRELRSEGRAEVEFERAGGEFLALTAPPWEFNIRTSDTGKLGVREFSVALKRDGRTQRTVSIGANVKVMRPVLVARRPLSVGACIRDDDLAAEERLFEAAGETGYGDPAELVGQQVQRFVPAGEMLKRGDVKAVDLVQRSRPVTVTGATEGVALQITGIALDAGGYGETVRVRLGDTRKDQREVRGVVTGIATVRIGEGA